MSQGSNPSVTASPCHLHPQGEALTCIAPKLLLWKFPQGSPAKGAGAQRLRGCCDEVSYEPLEKGQESGWAQGSNPSVTASPCHLP